MGYVLRTMSLGSAAGAGCTFAIWFFDFAVTGRFVAILVAMAVVFGFLYAAWEANHA